MCDLLLKNVEAAPTLNQTAKTIVDVFLKHVILRHGVPEKVLTDQGPHFEASITAELCKCLGISKLRTSLITLELTVLSNTSTACSNNLLPREPLGGKSSSSSSHVLNVRIIALHVYIRAHSSSKMTPFEVMTGEGPYLPIALKVRNERPGFSDNCKNT